MKEINIEGLQKKSFKPLGTNSRHDFGYSPNLLKEYGMPEPRLDASRADG
jgi:hypothetical protein